MKLVGTVDSTIIDDVVWWSRIMLQNRNKISSYQKQVTYNNQDYAK